MAKFFYKTLAVMVTAYCSGLLLQTSAKAEDSSVTEQLTASPAPTVVELPNHEMRAIAAKENTLASESSKESIPIAPVTNVSEQTEIGNTLASESSEDSKAMEPVTNVSGPTEIQLTIPARGNTQTGELSEDSKPMEQVNNVSQLKDVQPSDWAFEALRSLVERYGCIEGYPDRTYRGNRAMSRYEFAAGLNKCLSRINELISTRINGVTKEDLAKLQKLQEQFATELATLKNRVDVLEGRTTTIEQQQFSTTTKLSGQVSVYMGDAFGKNAGPVNHTALGYENYLTLITSFTGKDSLITTIGTGNVPQFNTATKFPTGRLSGRTPETNLGFSSGNGRVDLLGLQYSFQVNKNIKVNLDAYSSNRLLTSAITPLNNSFTGAISNFGRINTMLFPVGVQSGIGVQWKVAPWFSMDFALGSEYGSSDNPKRGLFNGGYGASVRPVISLGKLKVTGSYINSYSLSGYAAGAGSNAANVTGVGPVVANTYVGAIFYRFTPMFELGGSVAYANVRALGQGTRGDAQVWDYRANFIFYDLGKKGTLGGLIVGTQPRLTGTSNGVLAQAIGLPPGSRSDRDIGLYVEAFYGYPLSNNISITPGLIWLTAPNHDERNPNVVVGVIRTTFQF